MLELLGRHGEIVLGTAVLREQHLRDAVHVHVRRLRGEHHGHEKLELASELERNLRVGMRGSEPLDDLRDTLLLGGGYALARFVNVGLGHRGDASATASRVPSEDPTKARAGAK